MVSQKLLKFHSLEKRIDHYKADAFFFLSHTSQDMTIQSHGHLLSTR